MADVQPGEHIAVNTTVTNTADTGSTTVKWINLGGQQIKLEGYPGTTSATLTFPAAGTVLSGTTAQAVSAGDTITWSNGPDTTPVDLTPVEPSSYVEQLTKLTKAFKKLNASFKPADKGEVEGKGDQDSAEPVCYVSLDNRIDGIVYGSTTKAPKDVKVGDQVFLNDHNGEEDTWLATVAFIEGESIGYQVDWP